MWHWAFLIPLVSFGIPIVAIICHYWLKIKRAEIIRAAIERGGEFPEEVLALIDNEKHVSSEETRKHEKEMALIEKGLYESYQSHRSLKSGIILTSLGVAFTILVVVGGRHFPNEESVFPFLLAGLILLFLGIGFITFRYLSAREGKTTTSDDNSENG